MSVHYKFKSALEYDTVTFDGLHISVKDLKNAIVQQKRIGKNTDFDLQVTNAQTKEVYDDDNTLIPKNTSLLIARIPTSVQNKSKNWEGYGGDSTPPSKMDEAGPIAKAVDLSSIDAPEDDKIKAMMSQSTQDYDPSNYMKIRGANQMGAVPSNYRCYKCHQTGHWIKDCPLGQGPDPIEIKKSTGIPRSFMVPVEGPQVQGAMMTPNGSYAVPVLDHQAYTQKSAPAAPAMPESKPEIPEDLLCSICSDLLTDAVMIPCCGNSFCDECIRSCLLESEEHECPDCHEKDISPGTLIPNRFLRNSVANFKNTTGYVKKPVYKEKIKRKQEIEVKEDVQPPPVSNNAQKMKSDMEEKTVISEADSTEPIKTENVVDVKESNVGEEVKNESNELISDGPPGVSPKTSPQENKIANRVNPTDVREHTSRSSSNSKTRPPADLSPRKTQKTRKSPNYNENEQEDRPGTPTVDEPGMGNYHPPSSTYRNAPPAPGTIPSMMNLNPTPIQGPPPATTNYPPPPMGTFPPPHGPPPNFRLPPPGTAPPYMPPGNYPVPPRPMFDASRPPIAGIPPGFPPNYAAGSRPPHQSRDYSNRRLRDRTPPGIIDDPLAAFNKMLREKDERERRLKARNIRRSYSRSPSRGRSYSRSPRPRMRSRSPRRRQTPRSRSRSFTLSRSRSRSYSGGSIRGSPYRQMSPPSRRSPPPRRGGPSRYRSPIRSPPRHHRGDMRGRDFDYDRPYGGRGGDKDRYHHRDDRDRSRDRDRDRGRDRDNRYYDNYDDRGSSNNSRSGQQQQWNQSQQIGGQSGGRDGGNGSYYPEMQQSNYQTNRYPPRDYHQYMGKTEPAPPPPIAPHPMVTGIQPPVRRFDDIAPPGVEEPPVPGLETVPPRFERFETPVVSEKVEEVREKEIKTTEKGGKRKHDKRSRTPTRNPSPARKKSRSKERERERENDDKHKKARKRDHSDEKDEKKRESEEDKNKKSKDKRKRKDKKESEKKRKKDKKEKHKKDDKERKSKEKQVEKVKSEENVVPEEKTEEVNVEPPKMDLYDDVPMEEINKSFVEVENTEKQENIVETEQKVEEKIEKDLEDEKDILELHTTDIDLKAEFEKSEVLLPMPEKSKWEVEEDVFSQNSPHDSKHDQKIDKSGKVTNEVLKRAENAIFAKAINAIRPIEIKKISTDRAKLYTNEEKPETKPTVVVANVEQKKVTEAPPTRISVKDRLGVKVDEDNKHDRNPSRSLSPFSKRGDGGRNFERKVEVERYRRSRSRRRDGREHRRHDYRTNVQKSGGRRSSSKPKGDDRRKKRSRSVSSLDKKDKRRKKEKKTKKEKPVKKVEEEEVEKNVVEVQKPKLTTEKRKPTLDEATFEPDYDLESEPEKEVKVKESKKEEKAEMKESSSSDSSSSSSDDERRKRKHKKHRKKRKKESSSSSSESESESSDEEKEKRRKKHKKKQKKRKKSKHK